MNSEPRIFQHQNNKSGLQAHKLSATHLLASPDDNRNPLNDSTGTAVLFYYSYFDTYLLLYIHT